MITVRKCQTFQSDLAEQPEKEVKPKTYPGYRNVSRRCTGITIPKLFLHMTSPNLQEATNTLVYSPLVFKHPIRDRIRILSPIRSFICQDYPLNTSERQKLHKDVWRNAIILIQERISLLKSVVAFQMKKIYALLHNKPKLTVKAIRRYTRYLSYTTPRTNISRKAVGISGWLLSCHLNADCSSATRRSPWFNKPIGRCST